MNRPFKFRICYTDQNGKKSIIYSDNNRFLIGLNGKVYENYGKDWKNPMWEEVFDSYEPPIIQQYTGLNDKNGKEIYEGDIIRAMHDFGPAGFRSHISAIRWDKEVGYQWEYWDLSTIEIIGNILETKNYFNEIPQEVKNAAIFLGNYFKKQGIDNWTLYDVSSRK